MKKPDFYEVLDIFIKIALIAIGAYCFVVSIYPQIPGNVLMMIVLIIATLMMMYDFDA